MPRYVALPTVEEVAPVIPVSDEIDTAAVYADELPVTITLDGTPWIVPKYYSQYLAKDDFPKVLDIGLDPSLQQYVLIEDMVLMVTDDLSPDRNAETGLTRLEGSANMYPAVVPNVGDMFVARLRDGRTAIFVIKTAPPINHLDTTAYRVTYELFDYHKDVYINDLSRKVIATKVMDKDNPGQCKPLDSYQAALSKRQLGGILHQLVSWYYDEFYHKLCRTLLVPNDNLVYDPAVVKFFTRVVTRDLRGAHPDITEYQCNGKVYSKAAETILDVLADGNYESLFRVARVAYEANSHEFNSARIFSTVAMSPIQYVMWPSRTPTLQSKGSAEGVSYIMTESFYEADAVKMTALELLVTDVMAGNGVSLVDLKTEIDFHPKRTPLERFYHTPILIFILLKCIGG